ncbi:putative HTH-type transcriptional regulator [Candidatus Methanoperedenaceae archaeon GB50]|nr:putative HTH-type transcriptional regulator [Candidatus Methanoperedenaceae archaeon GB37]CAD7769670.1 putative HTH-type transcriptional regulator [Candidatus Methanoperedenaceae archaeon GB50]CAD7778444.1 MAG: putative HTH-type transcriptional regulator [Candidatus Methanoperedenaceae archaeon GB50]
MLDEVDRKIIILLQENGRITDVELAKKIGVSHDTAKRRRRRLEDEGYLKIQALINPRKFGYTSVFLLGIKLVPGADVRKTAEKLANHRDFVFVALSLGPTHAIIAVCMAQDQLSLNRLTEELRTWNEIAEIDMNIIYEVIKEAFHTVPIGDLR